MVEERNGLQYVVIRDAIIDIIEEKISIYLGNLFNGDKALGLVTNTFFIVQVLYL